MKKKILLLAGGGHAHVYILKQLQKKKLTDYEVIMVSKSERQYYSGMIAGFLEGIYTENQTFFDLPKICRESNVAFICDEIQSVDPLIKNIRTKSGKKIDFDIISFNTGSDVAYKNLPGVLEHSLTVKPLQNFCKIQQICLDAPKKGFNILIAGAGAAGIEMALAIKALSLREDKTFEITIVQSGKKILDGYPEKVKKAGLKKIENSHRKDRNETSIELVCEDKVKEIKPGTAVLDSGEEIGYDLAVWAAGSISHGIFTSSGLITDSKGYLLMNSMLQNENHPFIFGAGDCISLTEYPFLRKLGVFATRQAPLLYRNIVRYINGEKLMVYEHKKVYLSIIATGDKTAILSYGRFCLKGKLSWKLKNFIDLKFMRDFSVKDI